MLLREWRHRQRLTQVELARSLKITQSFLSRLESGEREPDLDLAHRIITESGGEVTLADLVRTAERG